MNQKESGNAPDFLKSGQKQNMTPVFRIGHPFLK